MGRRWGKKIKEKDLSEKVEETFLCRLDGAFGIVEASARDPQATTRPTLGVNKGPTKGSPPGKYEKKKRKRSTKEIDIELVGDG